MLYLSAISYPKNIVFLMRIRPDLPHRFTPFSCGFLRPPADDRADDRKTDDDIPRVDEPER